MKRHRSIVLDICWQHKISPDDFFGPSRSQRLAGCRRDAILALRAAGFTVEGCARMVRRHVSTVHYWLKPHNRAQRLKAMLERKAWKKNQKTQRYRRTRAEMANCMDSLIQSLPARTSGPTLS